MLSFILGRRVIDFEITHLYLQYIGTDFQQLDPVITNLATPAQPQNYQTAHTYIYNSMSALDRNVAGTQINPKANNNRQQSLLETQRRRNESEHKNSHALLKRTDSKQDSNNKHKYCSSQEWHPQYPQPQAQGELQQIYQELVSLKSQYKSLRKAYNKLIEEKSQYLQSGDSHLRTQLQKAMDENSKLRARVEFETSQQQRVRKEFSKLLEIQVFRNNKLQETLQEKENVINYLKREAAKENDLNTLNARKENEFYESNIQQEPYNRRQQNFSINEQTTIPLAQQLHTPTAHSMTKISLKTRNNTTSQQNRDKRTISEEDSDQDQDNDSLPLNSNNRHNYSTEEEPGDLNQFQDQDPQPHDSLSPERTEFQMEETHVLNNLNITTNGASAFMKVSSSGQKMSKAPYPTLEQDDEDRPLTILKLGIPGTTKNAGSQKNIQNNPASKPDLSSNGPETPNYTRRRSATGHSKNGQQKKNHVEHTHTSIGSSKKSHLKSKKDLNLLNHNSPHLELATEIQSAMLRKSVNTPSNTHLHKKKQKDTCR